MWSWEDRREVSFIDLGGGQWVRVDQIIGVVDGVMDGPCQRATEVVTPARTFLAAMSARDVLDRMHRAIGGDAA